VVIIDRFLVTNPNWVWNLPGLGLGLRIRAGPEEVRRSGAQLLSCFWVNIINVQVGYDKLGLEIVSQQINLKNSFTY
jgi:hypothetical protein